MTDMQVKERPILMSAPMVRALLAGTKTQTRRVVKYEWTHGCMTGDCPHDTQTECDAALAEYASTECPYGKPGDRLWVRESWQRAMFMGGPREVINYRADLAQWDIANLGTSDQRVINQGGRLARDGGVWKPSIYLPRWASRITLEVTEVRVQRLQEISAEDAEAEGLSCLTKDGSLYKYGIADKDGLPGNDDIGWPWHEWRISPVDAYEKLWEEINGAGSWGANPWVWAVSFKVVEKGAGA